MTILVIEDNAGISELIRNLLEEHGFRVDCVTSGKDALGYFGHTHPDFMMLDYSLPDMNGIEFIDALKKLVPKIPAYIVVTGMGDENIAVKMMKRGAKDYIIKDMEFLDRIPSVVKRAIKEVENEKRLEQAEKKLRDTFKLFEAVIEQSPIGTIIISPDGTLKIFNNSCAIILGIVDVPNIMLGANVFDIKRTWKEYNAAGKILEQDNRLFELSLKGKTVQNAEMYIVRDDGVEKWLMVNGSPIHDEQGSLIAGFVSFSDLTERKHMEEQLRQAEKMQAIGQLAGGVAHDFNNQLGGIVGYADLLREELSDKPTLQRYVDNILLSSTRAADLTSQLLAFARKGKFLSTIVDMNKIVEEVVEILTHTIDKNITIKTHLDPKDLFASGDPSQIQNMIVNLGLNARDAMPTGGELTFSTQTIIVDDKYRGTVSSHMEPGPYVQVCCSDTGNGMDEKTLNRIFEPFFTTKEQGKGTGMGLAAVYGTVETHNGDICVKSSLNNGTTVTILLPLVLKNIETPDNPKTTVQPIKGSLHILLADDEKIMNASCTSMLENLGYRVTSCNDGLEALEYYQSNWLDIDLVILDMVMPTMNGSDAYKKMKESNPNIIALVSSGYSLNEVAQEILDEGANGFIQKPFRTAELSFEIARVLTNHPALR